MRSILGPSLIAIGLLTVPGCVMPDRSITRSRGTSAASNEIADPNFDTARNNRVASRQSLPEFYQAGVVSTADFTDATKTNSADEIQRGPSHLLAGYSFDSSDDPGDAGYPKIRPAPMGSPNRIQRTNPEAVNPTFSSGFETADSPNSRLNSTDLQRTRTKTPEAFAKLQGVEFFDSEDAPLQPNSSSTEVAWSTLNRSDLTDTATRRGNMEQPTQHWLGRTTEVNASKPRVNRGMVKSDANSPQPSLRTDPNHSITPNSNADHLPPLPWQAELDRLIARVEQELAKSRSDSSEASRAESARRQAQLRLLYLMSQRQEDALTAIPGIDPSQQEYWQQMILAISNSLDTYQYPDGGDRSGQVVAPLSAALRQIRETAPLSIKNMGFCRKISYFGNYERFPRNEFTPGQEVLLYTEIENFVSSPTADGEYRTSLKSLVEILDSHGHEVWKKGFPPTEDFCRNPRRDYFHNYQFHIPKDLSTGVYSLKLTIEDELGRKRASNSLNFVLK